MRREESAAFLALNRRALRVLAALDKEIRTGGGEAAVSYLALKDDHHVDRRSISSGIKQVIALGLVDVRPGPRLVNIFQHSQRWRSIDAAAAERLSGEARRVLPSRRFEKAPVVDSGRDAPDSRPIAADAQPTAYTPSLPRLAWLEREERARDLRQRAPRP